MLEEWVVVAVVAAFLKPAYQALQKKATVTYSSLAVTQFTYAIVAATTIILSVSLRPELLSIRDTLVAAGIGAANSVALYAFVIAVREQDLSVVSPFQQTVPIFAAVVEPLVLPVAYSDSVLLGATLTVLGAYIILFDPSAPLAPLQRIQERGPLFALFTAATFAGTSIASRTVLDSTPVYAFLAVSATASFLVITIFRRGQMPTTEPNRWLAAYGATYAVNLGVTYLAFALTTASNATIVFRLALPLSVIIGALAFQEEHLYIRLAGAIVILVAVSVVIGG